MTRLCYLVCDGCGAEFGRQQYEDPQELQIAAVKDAGWWVHRDGHHACAECRPHKPPEQLTWE